MKKIKRIFQGIGILIGLIALYLLVVIFFPGITVEKQAMNIIRNTEKQLQNGIIKELSFINENDTIVGDLYLPDSIEGKIPCIVMATGFGGTKDFTIMKKYADHFQNAGFAAFAFDYRYNGKSSGTPRQLIRIPDQLEDIEAAVDFVKTLKEIDENKIALWGTSIGGGHVFTTAAEKTGIACIIAQCPALDGEATIEAEQDDDNGFAMLNYAIRDMGRSRFGLSAIAIPIVGKPGSIAFFPDDESYNFIQKTAPEGYANEACARLLLRYGLYRPVTYASEIKIPVLIQVCEKDIVTPMYVYEKVSEMLGELGTEIRYPIGHYDIYFGEYFEKSITDEITFLKKHLLK